MSKSAKEFECSLKQARMKATELKYHLEPLCEKVMVVGSIRRKESRIHDLDLVCIPRKKLVRNENDLFGQRTEVNAVIHWLENEKHSEIYQVKGGDRMRKITYYGMPVEIYMTTPEQFGRMVAIRTGPESYVKKIGARWVQLGYEGVNGQLVGKNDPKDIPSFLTEEKFFEWLCWKYIKPEARI